MVFRSLAPGDIWCFVYVDRVSGAAGSVLALHVIPHLTLVVSVAVFRSAIADTLSPVVRFTQNKGFVERGQ